MAPHNRTKNKNWVLLDHTADLRIEVRGKSIAEIFIHAAEALTYILTGGAEVKPTENRHIELEAQDLEDLLVEWLREILFQHQVYGKIFVAAETLDLSVSSLKACVVFGLLRGKSLLQFEIKGVTYHGLKIKRRGDRYIVHIIFDI